MMNAEALFITEPTVVEHQPFGIDEISHVGQHAHVILREAQIGLFHGIGKFQAE